MVFPLGHMASLSCAVVKQWWADIDSKLAQRMKSSVEITPGESLSWSWMLNKWLITVFVCCLLWLSIMIRSNLERKGFISSYSLHWGKSGQELKQRPRGPLPCSPGILSLRSFIILVSVKLIRNPIRTVTQFTFTPFIVREKGVGEWILVRTFSVHCWSIVLHQERSGKSFKLLVVPFLISDY